MKPDTRQKTSLLLTVIIVLLAATSSLGGLFLDGLYRDNAFVTLAWKGNDFVTLVIAVPMMILAMVFAKRGSIRAELVWLGTLDYMLYNFAYYLFGTAFNWFFLLYVALFTLSILALTFGLINIDATDISQRFRAGTPVRWISGYMLFVAIGLSTAYVIDSLNFIITGEIPAIIEMVEHPTNVVFALDLSLLVPVLVLGALWLWRRQPWGYVLSGIALVKGATYTLTLTVAEIWIAQAGTPVNATELPFWVFITLVGVTACISLYWNLREGKEINMERLSFGKILTIAVHAVVGWGLCGSVVGIGFAVTTEQMALIAHAVLAPVLIAGVSWIYFTRFNYTTPLQTGFIFLFTAIDLDFFVVALLIEKSFAMFYSLIGTWIPWALIFLSAYLTGLYVNRRAETATAA